MARPPFTRICSHPLHRIGPTHGPTAHLLGPHLLLSRNLLTQPRIPRPWTRAWTRARASDTTTHRWHGPCRPARFHSRLFSVFPLLLTDNKLTRMGNKSRILWWARVPAARSKSCFLMMHMGPGPSVFSKNGPTRERLLWWTWVPLDIVYQFLSSCLTGKYLSRRWAPRGWGGNLAGERNCVPGFSEIHIGKCNLQYIKEEIVYFPCFRSHLFIVITVLEQFAC